MMRTAFLASFAHDVHLGFADAIDADVFHFRDSYGGPGAGTPFGDLLAGARWPKYDAYVVEGSATLYAAAAHKLRRDAPVIYLGADRGTYALSPACERPSRDDHVTSVVETVGMPVVRAAARHTVDGAIVVSDFVADFARTLFGPETPIRVAHPYVGGDVYDALGDVDPDLDSTTAVTVGRAMEYKGIDDLVAAWPQVREYHPDAELHVVGAGDHPDHYGRQPGVTVRGYVEELADAFEPASLFVQPSRGDAFPVSTLEAMRSGVPPLVTGLTGTRSEARAVDDELVVDDTPDALAEGIIRYFDRPLNERRELSARARERGNRFDPVSRKAAFRREFESLVARLD